jgi:hypothetical protein
VPLDLDSALLATRETVQTINYLVADGWRLEQQGVALTLHRTGNEPRDLSSALSRLGSVLVDARLSGRWPGHDLQLQYVDGGFAIAECSPGDLRVAFEGANLVAAQNAWDGDAEAALSLSGSWTARGEVDPARLLQSVDTERRWYVLLSLDSVIALLAARPWWELAGLLEPSEMVVIAIGDAPRSLDVQTARLRIRSLSADVPWPPNVLAIDTQRAVGGTRMHAIRPGSDIPAPSTLAPTSDREPPTDSGATGLYAELWRCCAAAAWAWLATAVELNNEQSATLEFFGLQRTRHELFWNGPSIDIQQCRASYDLWRWVTSGDGPDQLLAARQVISLYRDAPPWNNASDIQRAAEPIFVALRSDATAEAFRMQREARALALTVARETAEATIGLAKGAVERCLAALAGIGGVIVAQTSHALTDSQASSLRVLIAVFLYVMAAWSAMIEGPATTIGLNNLPKDIGTLAELLSKSQQQEALDLATLKRAQLQSRIVKIAVPAAYLIAGTVALIIH